MRYQYNTADSMLKIWVPGLPVSATIAKCVIMRQSI